jgi:selenophosphate synthase
MKRVITRPFGLLLIITWALFAIHTHARTENKVLLRNVQSLTLRKDKWTTHRRVSAVPQVSGFGLWRTKNRVTDLGV